MCGRIAQAYTPEELAELLGITAGLDSLPGIGRSYNVPPTSVLAALAGWPDPAWTAFTWGFLPAWKTDGRAPINARSETVASKGMFHGAFARRRCVLPVTAYYEWQVQPGGGPKQPFCIRPAADEPLLLAGIYENDTCAILTRQARADLARIHDRMPVVLPRAALEYYLGAGDAQEATGIFAAADALSFQAYPVTRRVGNPRFDDPACLLPDP